MAFNKKKTLAFVYAGEDKEELALQLSGHPFDPTMCSENWQREPAGVIGVGIEFSNSWILRMKSFCGWNIVQCRYSVKDGKMSTFPFGREWDVNKMRALRERLGRQLTNAEMDTCLTSEFSSFDDQFRKFGGPR